MMKRRRQWRPVPGQHACYTGKSSRILKGVNLLEVVAESRGGRMIVKAIGYAGEPERFTVFAHNLAEPQPQLF